MVARIGCMYSDDWDFNDYEESERIRIDPNAIFTACMRSMVRTSPAPPKRST